MTCKQICSSFVSLWLAEIKYYEVFCKVFGRQRATRRDVCSTRAHCRCDEGRMHFVASFMQPSSACISVYSLLWWQQSLKNNLTFSAISDSRGLGDVAYQNGGLTLFGKHCPTPGWFCFLFFPQNYIYLPRGQAAWLRWAGLPPIFPLLSFLPPRHRDRRGPCRAGRDAPHSRRQGNLGLV